MYVRDVGVGEAVLLLHGTPCPATYWEPLVARLQDRFRVLVPDLPGYGQSARLVHPTVERVGDALATWLRDHDIHALRAIVGYSTGAYRAFDLALRHSVDIRVIVSLAGIACFDDDARALRRALAHRLLEDPLYLRSPEVRSILIDLMLSVPWRVAHPATEHAIASWVDATTSGALAGELLALAESRDLRPELARLRCPVYARVGALDVGCPPERSAQIVEHVARGELEVVPGCGHALLVEDLEATVAAVEQRIASAT